MKPDLVSFQGFGTYTYECRKRDCVFCEMMGLRPKPEIYVDDEIEFSYRNVSDDYPYLPLRFHRRTSKQWTKYEESILIFNKNTNPNNIMELLPGRTLFSILTRYSRLRKKGVI